jgi:hypothetical protein
MAKEIELTIMDRGPKTADYLKPLLDQFEAKNHIHVNFSIIPWETGRPELVKVALYRHGLDVSELGSTWVSDLIAMNALRPFSNGEINSFGGRTDFVSAAYD